MSKIVRIIGFIILLILMNSLSFSEKKFMLYGFRIGQTVDTVTNELGVTKDIMNLEDGFTIYIYKFKGYNVYFESDVKRPDLIWSIQIQGYSNSQYYGLDDINLGDDIEEAIKTLGEPDSVQKAIDEITKKEVEGVSYYDYYKSGNFSFETLSNKITSIKLVFNGPVEKEDPDKAVKNFLSAIKDKNYYQIASFFSPESKIYWGQKEYSFNTSILEKLMKNSEISNIIFDTENGVACIDEKDIVQPEFRLVADAASGPVYKIEKNYNRFEIFIVQSFSGWVISELEKR